MLWLDLDGPQADLERAYEEETGLKLERETQSLDWDLIKDPYTFFYNLPKAPDVDLLWNFFDAFSIESRILSGVPYDKGDKYGEEVTRGKYMWLAKHRGTRAASRAVFCATKDKSHYCGRGDIIIDDYPKYRGEWEKRGGIWIHHTSARTSLLELVGLMTTHLGLSEPSAPLEGGVEVKEDLILTIKEVATLKQCLGLVKTSQLSLVKSGAFSYHNKKEELSDLLNKLDGAYKDLLIGALALRDKFTIANKGKEGEKDGNSQT